MSAFRACCCLLLIAATGCTTTKTSNTARTGTEQLLISNAVDQALAKIDFQPMAGKKVLVEEKYMDCVDKGYIISSIRHHVVHVGGSLTAKPEEADIILEIRSGGVGTDNSDAYLGVPGIAVPGLLTLPDVKLVTRSRQSAFAKLGITAIDAKTQETLGSGGVSLAMSDDNNWYVMGVGPYRRGSMQQEVTNSLGDSWDSPTYDVPHEVAFRKPRANTRPNQSETAGRIQLTGGDDSNPAAGGSPSRSAGTTAADTTANAGRESVSN